MEAWLVVGVDVPGLGKRKFLLVPVIEGSVFLGIVCAQGGAIWNVGIVNDCPSRGNGCRPLEISDQIVERVLDNFDGWGSEIEPDLKAKLRTFF